jgi:hypothetical protein
MDKKYFVNPLAVLFHPLLDKKNNYETIVFNPQTENIFKINRFGYDILKTIEAHPSISLDYWQNEAKINKFIQQMVKENVVFEK